MEDTPKRILYVQGKAETGGSDMALLRLVEGLDRSRYTPIVLLPKNEEPTRDYEHAGATVVHTPLSVIRTTGNPFEVARIVGSLLPSARRVARIATQYGVALVHTNSSVCLSGPLAAWLADIPAVTHVRESAAVHKRIHKTVLSYMAALSDRLVVISHAVALGLPRYVRGGTKVRLVYDGVALPAGDSNARYCQTREAWGAPPGAFVVGVVGRITRMKGIGHVIEACLRAKQEGVPIYCVVVGGVFSQSDREYLLQLERLVQHSAIRDQVVFTGIVRDIAARMGACDVVVSGSTHSEGLGLTLLEAMACEVPVVATRSGGPEEVIEDRVTGYLVPRADPKAIAEVFVLLARDTHLRRQMGMAARLRAERHFSLEHHVNAMSAIYDEVLSLDRLPKNLDAE